MDMIGHSTDFERFPVFAADDAADVFVEIGADWCGDNWFAVFGAEDDVVEEVGERAGHRRFSPPVPDLRKSVERAIAYRESWATAYSYAASRLRERCSFPSSLGLKPQAVIRCCFAARIAD